MADLDDVVTALATRIRTGMAGTQIGGRVYAYGKDSIDPPCIVVLPSPSDFLIWDRTFDGSDEFSLTVKILMGSQDDRTGQAALMGYLSRSGTSIYAAIAADPKLNNTVSMTNSIRGTAYGDVEWAGAVMFGAEIVVECGT